MGLREILEEVESTYGVGVVAQASRGRSFKHQRFPTMVFAFDAAIGGGPVFGKFHLITGPPGAGKSTITQKAMAGIQLYCRYCRSLFRIDEHGVTTCACPTRCADCETDFEEVPYDGPEPSEDDMFNWRAIWDHWTCACLENPAGTKAKKDRVPKVTKRFSPMRSAWFDSEADYDANWAANLGVDNDLVYVFVPEYAEQGIDISDKLLRSGEIDFLGVDSVADLTPMKEIESSTEEWQMGLQARLVNKAFRKWGSALNACGANSVSRPTVFIINQEREDMEGHKVNPGGWAQQFKAQIKVRISEPKYKFKEHGAGDNKVQELQYADVSGFTYKNKTYPPKKRMSYRLYLADHPDHPAGSTNEFGSVVDNALIYGVVERPDPKKSTYIFGDSTWNSQKAIMDALRESHGLFWQIRDETMQRAVLAMA